MDILTLELFDVTVSRALLEVKGALDRHPGLPVRIIVDSDEMLRINVARFLERQGRPATLRPMGSHWQLDVPPDYRPVPVPPPPPPSLAPAFAPAPARNEGPRPVLLLRSAFAPGDRALGRRLLLGVLERLEAGTPWLLLAHEALGLLEDPGALEVLEALGARGIPVRLSRTSLAYFEHSSPSFEPMEDAEWQALLGRGSLTVL